MRDSSAHPANELLHLLPRTHHQKRGSKPQGQSLLAQDQESRKSESLDQVEVRIRHVTLDGGTLSRRLMHCNKPFRATNATQPEFFLRSPPIPLLFFFNLIGGEKENMVDHPREWTAQGRRLVIHESWLHMERNCSCT